MTETIRHSLMAGLYDTYVQTKIDIPFFLQAARQAGGEVLELMSGTGRVSLPLIEAGVRLTCVDYSPQMLAVLQEKLAARGLAAEVYFQDARRLSLGKQFDLVFIPFHSLAEVVSPDGRRAVLDGVHSHLAPHGTFICTLHNPAVRLKMVDGQVRLWGKFPLTDRPGKLLLWGLENYGSDSRLVQGNQFFELYDQDGELESRRLLETQFAIIERDEFEAMAQETGFRVEALYGDYESAPFNPDESPFMIWKLKKDT